MLAQNRCRDPKGHVLEHQMDPAEPFSGYIEIPKEPEPDFVAAAGSHFTGTPEPMWELKREMPWHRFAAFAFGLGATAKDAARRLRKSEPAAQNLLAQPWLQR